MDSPRSPNAPKRAGSEVTRRELLGTIANTIFHATAKRIRELPVTPGKLL